MFTTATQLARDAQGHWLGEAPATWSGWAIDSRKVQAGEIFVALKTERQDGHAYVGAAAAAGAVAALVAQPVAGVNLPQLVVTDPAAALARAAAAHRQRFFGPVVGVTGSSGKTSTKEILARVLGDGSVHRTAGNLNNQLGVPLTLLGLLPTHRTAVIEAGMNTAGEMAALTAWIDPTVAVVTMVGPAHLERLGSVAAVAREKAALVHGLRAGGWGVVPHALLEWPDFAAAGDRLVTVDAAPAGTAEVSGAGACARWAAGPAETWELSWVERQSGQRGEVTVPRVSAGQLSNLALALTVGARLGQRPEAMAAALADWTPGALRGRWLERHGRRWYIDCYNANPASLLDAAGCFALQCPPASGPRVWVLGCLGELGAAGPAWHEQVGRQLPVAAADRILLVGPGELAGPWRAGLVAAGARAGAITRVDTAAELAGVVPHLPGPVFLKGSRVHRLEQLLPPAASPALSHAFAPR